MVDEVISLSCFPNPSGSFFTLSTNSTSQSEGQLTVYDVLGQEVERIQIRAMQTQLKFGDALQPGVYIAKVSTGMDQKIFRLVKE